MLPARSGFDPRGSCPRLGSISVIGSSTAGLSHLRPLGLHSLRLYSGLVLFTYVALHLINHSLGNLSLAWMERGLAIQRLVWQGILGTVALYGALTIHSALVRWRFTNGGGTGRRARWRNYAGSVYPAVAREPSDGHAHRLRRVWREQRLRAGTVFVLDCRPGPWQNQPAAAQVRAHGCLGVAFYLAKALGSSALARLLIDNAGLLSVLALLAFAVGREVVNLARDPAWLATATAPAINGTPPQRYLAGEPAQLVSGFRWCGAGSRLAGAQCSRIRERPAGRVRISYPHGGHQVDPNGIAHRPRAHLLARVPQAEAPAVGVRDARSAGCVYWDRRRCHLRSNRNEGFSHVWGSIRCVSVWPGWGYGHT